MQYFYTRPSDSSLARIRRDGTCRPTYGVTRSVDNRASNLLRKCLTAFRRAAGATPSLGRDKTKTACVRIYIRLSGKLRVVRFFGSPPAAGAAAATDSWSCTRRHLSNRRRPSARPPANSGIWRHVTAGARATVRGYGGGDLSPVHI